MSWSPELRIGELRPWPDSVHVMRGKTDEKRRYVPERKTTVQTEESCQNWYSCNACNSDWYAVIAYYYCPWCGAKVVS